MTLRMRRKRSTESGLAHASSWLLGCDMVVDCGGGVQENKRRVTKTMSVASGSFLLTGLKHETVLGRQEEVMFQEAASERNVSLAER